MGREDLAGIERDDRDLRLIDDGQDPPTGVGGTDLEVIQATGPSQGHGTLLVGDVVAQAEVARCAATGRMRLGRRPVGRARGDPPGRPVRPLLVVGEPEGIELALELGDRACRRLLPEPALQGLVEALDLALGLGMPWGAVLLADAEVGEQVLEAVAAAGEA